MTALLGYDRFIYLLEGTGSQSEQVVRLRERMLERDDELCTSTLTLGEVLVKPVERGARLCVSVTRTCSPAPLG